MSKPLKLDFVGFLVFCDEALVADENSSAGSSAVYESFLPWCLARGIDPWSQKAMSMTLQGMGAYRKLSKKRCAVLHGLRLKAGPMC